MRPESSDQQAPSPPVAEGERQIFGDIQGLECLRGMTYYYQTVYQTIRHLVDPLRQPSAPELGMPEDGLVRLSVEEVRSLRRFINSDLEQLGIEFYLQRVDWALACHPDAGTAGHKALARQFPARHPCAMKGGFKAIADSGDTNAYPYEEFLAETHAIFAAIHAHLVSINRAFGELYYHVAELPFASFTPAGKSEIGHLSSELNRLMRGLLVATHLQPQEAWQSDLVSYLLTCRADCQRFFETIPHYYQMHRLRLVVYPIGTARDEEARGRPHQFPLACLPWSAGVYLDFLNAYQNIAHHTLAVIHWSIRLYARWYFVPRRVLQAISPISS